jgi:hypothetical protein
MSEKCQWVESHLEGYFSNTMESDARAELERHAAACAACGGELAAFATVDKLVSAHFRQQLRIANRTGARGIQPLRLAGAVATAAGVFVAVWIGVGALRPASAIPETAGINADAGGEAGKADESPDAERAKPNPASAILDRRARTGASPGEGAEEHFYVQDAAGYFHTLEDFRGSVLVLGVIDGDAAHIAGFEQAYERYGPESALRFLAVSTAPDPRFMARFPTMANRNSTLLETPSGEFVILAPDLSVYTRGTLGGNELIAAIEAAMQEDLGAR